jgi:thiol-disulfide isomerase/thioredoxin
MLTAAYAVEIGEDAPELRIGKWLMNGPVKVEFDPNDKTAGQKLFVYLFWGSWSSPSRDVVPLLALLQKKYNDKQLKIILISREDEAAVNKFLGKNSIGGCAMALDEKSATTLMYMGNDRMYPKAFVIGNGNQLLWSGEAVDLPDFFSQFYSNSFNIGKQKEKSALTLELKVALQQQSAELIRSVSDAIFKLDPEDGFALRTRLFLCENDGNIAEAFQLLNKMLNNSAAPKLFFIKLDLIARYPEFSENMTPTAQLCLEKFAGNQEALNNLAWILLERFPYTPGTLEIAAAAVERANALMQQNSDKTFAPAIYNTQALVYYKSGLLQQAVASQQRAIELSADNPAAVKSGNLSLEYYQNALKLQQRGNNAAVPAQ